MNADSNWGGKPRTIEGKKVPRGERDLSKCEAGALGQGY